MKPEKIGRYQVEKELGRGGMSTVFLARDPRSEREVAIKVLPPEMLHDPQFRTRFEREAKVIARLEHPAIVPVYDFGEDEGQPYFVMRYMTGSSLSQRLKTGPLTIHEAARLLTRIAPALDSAHARGIIHRDLKPGNILFDQYGEPYISDFGIAKLTEGQGSSMTGSGIVGTPAYMSPEQAQGEGVDSRSDVYGLGVILFEALTGRQPFSGDTPMSVVLKHITDPIPHILDVKSDLPAGIEKVVEKALAKDKKERFATCQALADAVEAVSRGEIPDLGPAPTRSRMAPPKARVASLPSDDAKTVAGPPAPVKTAPAPRRRSLVGVLVAVGLVSLLLLVAGGLFIFRDQIPFLSALFPARATPSLATSPEVVIPSHTSSSDQLPLVPTNTVALATTEAPTLTVEPGLPAVGGADLIAFLNANNIWLMGADGADLRQMTSDGAAKHSLQFSPDGDSLLYIVGKCIQVLDVKTAGSSSLACFSSAEFLDDLSISPDGTRIAVSLDGTLYVVDYDLAALGEARDHNSFRNMMGCFTYDKLRVKGVRFSSDGSRIAILLVAPVSGGSVADVIQVLDITACSSASYGTVTTFPGGGSFVMTGYAAAPVIPSFEWNGSSLFLLNTRIRNEFYGYLYSYDIGRYRYEPLDPLKSSCCYSDATWSPDGSYIFFSYQNMSLGSASQNELYFIPFGTIGTGALYTPIDLPVGFLTNPREHPEVAFRPAR